VTVWWIIHHPMQYTKYCWVRFLSNLNIKYICTIYTRLHTCLMSICTIALRDKVALRLWKLYFNIVEVVEWSRALDIRLSGWCCSVSMVWVQIPSTAQNIILTLFGLIFRRIYIYIDIRQHVFIKQSHEIKYIIQTSKQMTTIQYFCPTGSQSYLWY
jgi:hypothetical protein